MSERTRRRAWDEKGVVSTAAGSQTALQKEPRGIKKSMAGELAASGLSSKPIIGAVHSMSNTNRASSAMTSMN
jgi:hypothetical protein